MPRIDALSRPANKRALRRCLMMRLVFVQSVGFELKAKGRLLRAEA